MVSAARQAHAATDTDAGVCRAVLRGFPRAGERAQHVACVAARPKVTLETLRYYAAELRRGGRLSRGAAPAVDLAPLLARLAALEARPAPVAVLDPAALEPLVAAAVERLAPRPPVVVEVRRRGKATQRVEGGHHLLPRLVRLLGAGVHVYLWGPKGSGKSTAIAMAARALGARCDLDTLSRDTTRAMVQGFINAVGEPVGTAFSRAWAGGYVYCAEELDSAPAAVQNLFNCALTNDVGVFPWGNEPRHDAFVFAGNGNTPGRATAAYPDRLPMSAAFQDRLYYLHWPIDPGIELRAAGLPALVPSEPAPTTCDPANWVRWVQAVRAWFAAQTSPLEVSPRASLAGLGLLALGEAPEQVAEGLVFRGCDAELRRKALFACPLPAGTLSSEAVKTLTEVLV
jgi:hypothetical protein